MVTTSFSLPSCLTFDFVDEVAAIGRYGDDFAQEWTSKIKVHHLGPLVQLLLSLPEGQNGILSLIQDRRLVELLSVVQNRYSQSETELDPRCSELFAIPSQGLINNPY